jgi:membrane fusion protein, multidrug efflux system
LAEKNHHTFTVTRQSKRIVKTGVIAVVLGAVAVGTYFIANGRTKESGSKGGKGPAAVLITATVVQPRALEVYEDVVGSLENVIDPTVGAEVAGRITRVHGFTGKKISRGELLAEIDAVDFEIQSRADSAEIGRLTSLLQQQERVVERQQKLVGQGFISQNAADDAIAQRNALREQLNTARARSDATGRSVTKARVVAPIDGEIETQIIAVGDYVKLGDPLFKLVGVQDLRAHLFLPESAATRIRPGLKVILSPPAAPERTIETTIGEIKPTVGANNRALDAIVKFRGEGNLFRGGGTVNARIVTQVREGALMVPEQSIVLRPAGKVVYVLREGIAEQRIVETGQRLDGFQEVTKGLKAGESIAVDGAGFLTQGAAVTLPKPKPAAERGEKKGDKS